MKTHSILPIGWGQVRKLFGRGRVHVVCVVDLDHCRQPFQEAEQIWLHVGEHGRDLPDDE